MEILLNSKKNIASVNVTNYINLELSNNNSEILEYDIRNAVNATEVFEAERNANDVYRIYGRIEYLSLLNRLKLDYKIVGDFFLQSNTNIKTIYNSFDFYLLRATTGYTKITGTIPGTVSNDSGKYVRYFEVIATPNDFELYNAGFTKNVYGDQIYAFNFNRDFDISTYLDEFNFPATELFLFAKYKPSVNGWNQPETMSGTTFNIDGTMSLKPIYSQTITYGTRIYGDLVEYSKPLFYEEQSTPQLYYITTPYKENNVTKYLEWEYNPFIPLRLRYFYDDISRANSGDTSYEQQTSIPAYATEYPSNTGNYIWKNIIPQGQIDPLTDLGVDYPFINERRYLFAALIIDVSPNMDDANTSSVFSSIRFGPPTVASKTPLNNINDITKPC